MERKSRLSMSIMLDNRKSGTEMSIPKISPAIWIPSKNITKCHKCGEEFRLWIRKHHCRVCGRIFCAYCSNNWGHIPSLVNMTSPPEKGSFSILSYLSNRREKRMCMECKNKIDFINNSSKYIYIFSNLPITLKDLYNVRLVNKQWCKTISTILSSYKSTQYKLPTQCFSKLEKQFYWTHRYEFLQHFQLMIKCISSANEMGRTGQLENLIKFYSTNIPRYHCNELACRRNCSSTPKIEEILEICNNKHFLNNKRCRKWIMKKLTSLDTTELHLLMPWLLKICIENFKIAEENIIPLCLLDKQLIFSFYFECKFYMLDPIYKQKLNPAIDKFLSLVGEKFRTELSNTQRFINLVNNCINHRLPPKRWEHKSANFFQKYEYILLPWDINIKCIGIMHEGIMQYKSATNPWKIPLIIEKNKQETILNILVKSEDVRKDKLTMIIANMIKKVCGDIVDITTYSIFPIGKEHGWIEMVEEANTLYDIKYKYDTTIQNYIMDLNPQITVNNMRQKFIQTCVSSCVLCYVLGVGDRHLENILVTKTGKLLHIDFSYILGDDPKNLGVEMKITEDMLNMLGGKASKCFRQFKRDCKEAYKRLRLRSSLWYILLTYLVFTVPSIDNYKYTKDIIKNHVIERLIPGETDTEASMQIIDIVERSSNSSWGQSVAEWTHILGNQFRHISVPPMLNLEL